MGSAFSSAGRVKAPAMRRDAAMASATSLGWVLSPAVMPAARARISSSVIEMVAPMLRGVACRKSLVSGTLGRTRKRGEVRRPHPRGVIHSAGCCAVRELRRQMGETKSLRKLATEISIAAKDCCSVSMAAISWIWQRGNTRKNLLKDCGGKILWIGFLWVRERRVVGTVGPDVEGENLCVALVQFLPRLGFC